MRGKELARARVSISTLSTTLVIELHTLVPAMRDKKSLNVAMQTYQIS